MFAVTGTDEILLLGEVTADADGNFVYELTAENLSSLGKVSKAIRATQTDAAGNSETTQLFTFAVDTRSAHSFRLRLSVETRNCLWQEWRQPDCWCWRSWSKV